MKIAQPFKAGFTIPNKNKARFSGRQTWSAVTCHRFSLRLAYRNIDESLSLGSRLSSG
jgi:hypothetical protein